MASAWPKAQDWFYGRIFSFLHTTARLPGKIKQA
jgi:hypothetical protein